MILSHLSLQNFRNYKKSEFKFSEGTTLVVGFNTAGKTNLLEAISLLSTGKSFRAQKDIETLRFGEEIARVRGETDKVKLEVVITNSLKKYLVNGVSKRRLDFAGRLTTVLFSPLDLEIVVDSPSRRRQFLDSVLEQVDREYRLALEQYLKSLRQRNALLEKIRETGILNQKQFEYWDNILIENGEVITKKREELTEFINKEEKDIFNFSLAYDKSIISRARLEQYQEAERAAGVTLVGPHRDEIIFKFKNGKELKAYGSRGEQRLTILQLKLLELNFIETHSINSGQVGERPVLLLDDIFSELDSEHINHVLKLLNHQQTIITTTHKEFVPKVLLEKIDVIELEKDE